MASSISNGEHTSPCTVACGFLWLVLLASVLLQGCALTAPPEVRTSLDRDGVVSALVSGWSARGYAVTAETSHMVTFERPDDDFLTGGLRRVRVTIVPGAEGCTVRASCSIGDRDATTQRMGREIQQSMNELLR